MTASHSCECGKQATCFGAYEGGPEAYGCDDCCGHGNEDGYCEPVAARPASDAPQEAPMESEDPRTPDCGPGHECELHLPAASPPTGEQDRYGMLEHDRLRAENERLRTQLGFAAARFDSLDCDAWADEARAALAPKETPGGDR